MVLTHRVVAARAPRGYATHVTPINLADPEFEPSDEQLVGLSVRAFAGVREANAQSQRDLRAQIETARAEALAALEVRLTRGQAPA